MALATTLMAVGIPAEQANRLGYEDRVPLDGNGTTQAGATEIIATNTNVAAGTSAGDTAFILPPDAEYFQPYFVLNTTPEPALIFPPVGDTIDANAVDAAVEIEEDLARVFQRVEEGRWVSFPAGEGGGGIDSVVAGTGIAVDNTDPDNPVISNTGVLSVSSGAGISVDVTDPQNPIVINTGVLSVTAGSNITIGGTAQNPTISGNAGTVTAVSIASANGFAGSSSGGATPELTVSTTITGILQGNGTAISGNAPLTDLAAKWTAASGSGPASLAFAEDTDNGVNTVSVAAPALLTGDRTIALPDESGTVLLAVSPSIDNYVPRFDGTSGKLQSSVMRILDSGTLVANDDQNAYAIIAARFSSGFGGSAITTSLASTFLDFQVANVTVIRFNLTGLITRLFGSLSRSAPVTKTADFTVADSENWLINNKAGSACVVTLPAASSYSGREIMLKTIQAQQVNSASSNVVPLGGGAAGTAILTANAGRWATLVSNGTNWEIMAGVV